MIRPVRVQLRRVKGWRMPPNTVSVARPSPFGNYAGTTRAAYEADIAAMSNADKAFFMDQVKTLRGKNLACWCPLDRLATPTCCSILPTPTDPPNHTAPPGAGIGRPHGRKRTR